MTEPLPRARDDVERVVVDGEAVVYDPVTGDVHHLNATATVVWQCCDGTGTVDALVDDLAATYHAPRSQVATDVGGLLDDLTSRHLLVGAAPAPLAPPAEEPPNP
jgi:PqqD family protein of HPr-rel-A system